MIFFLRGVISCGTPLALGSYSCFHQTETSWLFWDKGKIDHQGRVCDQGKSIFHFIFQVLNTREKQTLNFECFRSLFC